MDYQFFKILFKNISLLSLPEAGALLAEDPEDIPLLACGLLQMLVWMCRMGSREDLFFMLGLSCDKEPDPIVESLRDYVKNRRSANRSPAVKQQGRR
jgi:hypothetical protein